MNLWEVAGLAFAACLVLIPAAMVGRIALEVVMGYREHRRREAATITVTVPGLGAFSTTDQRFWSGEVGGVLVTLVREDQPPGKSEARRVLALLAGLPVLTERAARYLDQQGDYEWLDRGSTAFEALGLDLESRDAFVLELTHPADADGIYRVEFRDGEPVSAGRDD